MHISPAASSKTCLPPPEVDRRKAGASAAGTKDDLSVLPDWDDLRAKLRFSVRDGRIWLDDQRMLLIHLSSFAALRRELIDMFGVECTRGLLTRMGYASGTRDAEIARKVRPGASYFDILAAGPQLHALEGIVAVDPGKVEVDVAKGIFYGEFIWRDSSEVDSHLAHSGGSVEPVCWMQIGYAMGYTSAFMGKQIFFREVQCRAMGHPVCRIVGKPVEEWHDAEEDLRYLQPEGMVSFANPAKKQAVSLPEPRDHMIIDQLVGTSSGFSSTCHMIQKVAKTSATVLFLGETGVGKEMFARALHRLSNRAEQPFVAINCAAIPENLVESELFGVEKGAFTGALQSRPGRFERAEGGTLFLDEVGTLNLIAQSKLLRVLQEREVERVGDIRSRKIDVRVVAATNVNLQEAVRDGRFREDLYFRLNVFPVRIPPLRERRDDVPMLMEHFLKRFTALHGRRIAGFSEQAVGAMFDHNFPGNIREMENMIERAVILAADDSVLDIGHLFPGDGTFGAGMMGIDRQGRCHAEPPRPPPGQDTGLAHLIDRALEDNTPLEEVETMLIRAAVQRAGGNLSLAARSLGMTRPQIAYRFSKLDEE